ncbi:MAG TPA: hypothetical protein VGD10_02310 [Allosphingosinicella sp.]|uniref:hypothetical protein n=1 Tax=Allosphingosinicella sp. TaxID=2823234 RepID=UPI002EDAC93A
MKTFGAALLAAATAVASCAAPAFAAETITYSYDVHGRLVKVERQGTVNSGKVTTYTIDKADNRASKTTN